MFIKFKTTLIAAATVFMFLLIFSGKSIAFEIEVLESDDDTYVEYASGSLQNIWHLAYIETDEPYYIIDWYIDDVHQESDAGDNVKTEAYFWPYWLTGSGTGTTYTIKARARSLENADGDHEEDIASYTITVYQLFANYIGPSTDSQNYCFTGNTHNGQIEVNQPYLYVYWYVKGPNETGYGTLVKKDQGNGTSKVSNFDYTFSSGSTSGDEYVVTAHVTAAHGQSVTDQYTVTVYDEVRIPISSVTYREDTDELCFTYNTEGVPPTFAALSVNMQLAPAYFAQIEIAEPLEAPGGGPPANSGFRPPKNSNNNGKVRGRPEWRDRYGNVWRKDPSEHAGPHWDVTFPSKGYINVYPPTEENEGWKTGDGKIKNRNDRIRKEGIESRMNKTVPYKTSKSGSSYTPRNWLTILGGAAAGYLIFKGAKTVIGVILLPTPLLPVGGVLILTP